MLLNAVVETALDPAALAVGRGHDARSRRAELLHFEAELVERNGLVHRWFSLVREFFGFVGDGRGCVKGASLRANGVLAPGEIACGHGRRPRQLLLPLGSEGDEREEDHRCSVGLVIVCASLGVLARSALSASAGVRPGAVADSALKGTIVSWATRLQQDAAVIDLQCASCLQTGGHTIIFDAGQAARAVKRARPATKTGTRARALAVQAFNGFAATGQQLVKSGQAAAQSTVAAAVGQAKLSAHLAAQAARALAQARIVAQNAGARVVSADHLIPTVSGVIPPFDLHITAISSGAPKIYTGDTLTVTYRLRNDWTQALGGRTTR